MKAVIAITVLALLSGCNKNKAEDEYNFTISHITPNYWRVYQCDDFLITHGFITFVDHNGVKRTISGNVDIQYRRNDLTRN